MLERVQIPSAEARRASAFGDWTGTAGDGITISERQGLAVIELAAFSRSAPARDALARELGIALPAAGASAETSGIAALSIGPARWLILGSEAAATSLPVPSEAAAGIVDLSHGRAVLTLAGVNAVYPLIKGTSLDLDPAVFTDGSVAATALARMPVVIWRRGGAFDVIVPRSYAVALLEWLIAASA
jgi:methylglutamate dehydrogenase subunit D